MYEIKYLPTKNSKEPQLSVYNNQRTVYNNQRTVLIIRIGSSLGNKLGSLNKEILQARCIS